jgi:hypothetical protein
MVKMLCLMVAWLGLGVVAVHGTEGLLLSKMIRAGNVSLARETSKVNMGGHSGYLSTDPKDIDRLWFWFFHAKDESFSTEKSSNKCTPLILWMQGGPGVSGQIGALNEMGPLYLQSNGKTVHAENRTLTWNRKYVNNHRCHQRTYPASLISG